MKRTYFTTLFIGTNILFVLAHLYKQSLTIKFSYDKQKIELEERDLIKQKQVLSHQLHTIHDRAQVKQFAAQQLSLKPVKISQIKKITHDSNI